LSAKQSVEGFSAGVYGTWRGNHNMPTGPYVDTWLMYGTFNNRVTGQGLASESYRSRNLAASLEGGYAFQIFDSANVKQYLEPQVQVIYSNYGANDHTEANGTVVSGMGANSVTTRVGVRLRGDMLDDAGSTKASPFAELNWWHGPSSQSMQFDNTLVNATLPANRGEFKVGLQGNVTKNLSLWGSAGVLTDMGSYTEGRFQAGVRYRW
jgi:outer membrane autotransporter protein